MRCEAFAHLRGPEVFLDNDVHLVQYIRQALQLREEKEKELEKEKVQEKEQEAGRTYPVKSQRAGAGHTLRRVEVVS